MKIQKVVIARRIGVLALVAGSMLAGPLASSYAQGTAGTGTGTGAGTHTRKGTGKSEAKRETTLEAETGITLTEDQRQQLRQAETTREAAVKAARETFEASEARIVGMSPADLAAKKKAYRDAHRKPRKKKGA